jgi:hypothetical protein
MLDALNRTVLAEVRDALALRDEDLFFVQHESEEFLNVARRQAQVDFSKLEVKVPDKPIVFLRLDGVDYGKSMTGYKRVETPYVYLSDLGKYVGVKLLSVEARYRLAVFVPFGRVAMDLVGVLMSQLKRSSSIVAVSADKTYSVELPVSLLLENINPPVVEMVLREKGMKLYRVEGELQALGFMLQMGVKGMGSGEYGVVPGGPGGSGGYGVGIDGLVEYKPIKEIKVQWKIGWSVFTEDGEEVNEVLPCVLNL